MSRAAQLTSMFRTTEREFRRIKRIPGLTRKDKQELQTFYIDRILAPETARILGSENGNARLPMLTAIDLEAWLKIDRKTIYSYVTRNIIPYIRVESNVRFVEADIRRWLKRHRFRARHRNIKRALAHGVLLPRAALD